MTNFGTSIKILHMLGVMLLFGFFSVAVAFPAIIPGTPFINTTNDVSTITVSAAPDTFSTTSPVSSSNQAVFGFTLIPNLNFNQIRATATLQAQYVAPDGSYAIFTVPSGLNSNLYAEQIVLLSVTINGVLWTSPSPIFIETIIPFINPAPANNITFSSTHLFVTGKYFIIDTGGFTTTTLSNGAICTRSDVTQYTSLDCTLDLSNAYAGLIYFSNYTVHFPVSAGGDFSVGYGLQTPVAALFPTITTPSTIPTLNMSLIGGVITIQGVGFNKNGNLQVTLNPGNVNCAVTTQQTTRTSIICTAPIQLVAGQYTVTVTQDGVSQTSSGPIFEIKPNIQGGFVQRIQIAGSAFPSDINQVTVALTTTYGNNPPWTYNCIVTSTSYNLITCVMPPNFIVAPTTAVVTINGVSSAITPIWF